MSFRKLSRSTSIGLLLFFAFSDFTKAAQTPCTSDDQCMTYERCWHSYCQRCINCRDFHRREKPDVTCALNLITDCGSCFEGYKLVATSPSTVECQEIQDVATAGSNTSVGLIVGCAVGAFVIGFLIGIVCSVFGLKYYYKKVTKGQTELTTTAEENGTEMSKDSATF